MARSARAPVGFGRPLDLGTGVPPGSIGQDTVVAADLFAASVQSRVVTSYAAARSQAINSFDNATVIAGAWASVSTQPSRARYRGSYSMNASAADAEIIPDSWASQIQSRRVPQYAPQPSRSTPPPDFATILDTWAATTFGRATPYYKGQRAITISVYDPATNTFADWTPAALLSRAVQDYAPPRSRALGSFGLSITPDQVAPVTQSRSVALYRSSAAFLARAFDQPSVVFGTDYVAPALSRRGELYRAPRSLIFAAWDDHACTTLFPDTMLLPDDPLFPTLCDQLGYVPLIQSRQVDAYRGSYSAFMGAADQAILGSSTDYASIAQSRPGIRYLGSKSLVLAPYSAPLIVFGTTWASVIQSRPVKWYSARSWMGKAWTLGSGVDPGPPPPQPDPYVPNLAGYGGGGFGAVMSDDFFKRYEARYKPRYVGRYKPTIRKQKP